MARYVKTGEVQSTGEAITRLFLGLGAHALRPDHTQREFMEEFHTESCDLAVRNNEALIRTILRKNRGGHTTPGLEPKMSLKQFERVLENVGAFTKVFPSREASYAFMLGMQLRPDELYTRDYPQMCFLEF